MLNLLADVILWFGNLICDAIDAAWAVVDTTKMGGYAQWFKRLDQWVAISELGAVLGVLVGIMGVMLIWKIGCKIMDWVTP